MNIQDFSRHVEGFMRQDPDAKWQLCNFAMGLAGEIGEFVDLIKKTLFHGESIPRSQVTKELGDILWYWFALCISLGFDPEDIMEENIKKLQERHKGNSFNPENALAAKRKTQD